MNYDECFDELRRLHAGFRRDGLLTAERARAFHAHYRPHDISVLRQAVDRSLRGPRLPDADQLDQLVDQIAERARQTRVHQDNAVASDFFSGRYQSADGHADPLWVRMHLTLIRALIDGRLKLDTVQTEQAKENLAQHYAQGAGEEWIAQIAAIPMVQQREMVA